MSCACMHPAGRAVAVWQSAPFFCLLFLYSLSAHCPAPSQRSHSARDTIPNSSTSCRPRIWGRESAIILNLKLPVSSAGAAPWDRAPAGCRSKKGRRSDSVAGGSNLRAPAAHQHQQREEERLHTDSELRALGFGKRNEKCMYYSVKEQFFSTENVKNLMKAPSSTQWSCRYVTKPTRQQDESNVLRILSQAGRRPLSRVFLFSYLFSVLQFEPSL
jgi:hypothetical protein